MGLLLVYDVESQRLSGRLVVCASFQLVAENFCCGEFRSCDFTPRYHTCSEKAVHGVPLSASERQNENGNRTVRCSLWIERDQVRGLACEPFGVRVERIGVANEQGDERLGVACSVAVLA